MALGAGENLILVVEDESALAESIAYSLEVEGFAVAIAGTGPAGLEMARRLDPDLVVLDVMLPGMSGLDLCRRIRASSAVPIIMLTARDSEGDKVAGLELGADDYVTKPFSMVELAARVRAQMRRATLSLPAGDLLTGSGIELDTESHEVKLRGDPIDLTPKEYELLVSLMSRKGKLASRDALIAEVWGHDYVGDTKTLDVHVKRLRTKLESDPSQPRAIVTVRGFGYKFLDA